MIKIHPVSHLKIHSAATFRERKHLQKIAHAKSNFVDFFSCSHARKEDYSLDEQILKKPLACILKDLIL
jgi:hypothetical protein